MPIATPSFRGIGVVVGLAAALVVACVFIEVQGSMVSGYPIKYSNTPASVRAGGVGFTGVITVRAHTKSSSDAVRRTLNVTLNK